MTGRTQEVRTAFAALAFASAFVVAASPARAADEASDTATFKSRCDADPTMNGSLKQMCTCLAVETMGKATLREELLARLKNPEAPISTQADALSRRCHADLARYKKSCDVAVRSDCMAA